MASQPVDKPSKDEGPRRKWTNFEASVLMSLIIRNVHKTGLEKDEFSKLSDSTALRPKHRNTRRAKEVADPDRLKYVDVATALNRALHKSDYTHDIPVKEVEKLLHFFLRDRKGAIAVIDRQPTARLTRTTHKIWARGLKFLGTKAEWDNGRKAAEEIKRREDQERRLNVGIAGAITSTANATGVHDGWGDDTAAALSGGDGWGTVENENNTDAFVVAGVWGDVMKVDTTAINPKAHHGTSIAKDNYGAWGLGAADSSAAAVTNATDPWGAGAESTFESSSATAAWGEPEASETVTTTIAAASDQFVHEDPFATPIPPSLSSSVNKATIPSNAWSTAITSDTTNPRALIEFDPWNQTSVSRADPVSKITEDAWRTTTGDRGAGVPSTATNGTGKPEDTSADPRGAGAEPTAPSLHNIADTAANPWDTSAPPAAIQTSPMDWNTKVSDVTRANPFDTKVAGETISAHRAANPWGESVNDVQVQSAIAATSGWGPSVPDKSHQHVIAATDGWRDSIEKSQGRTQASQTATTASLSHGEGAMTKIKVHGEIQRSKTPPPVPPGLGPAQTTLKNPAVDAGSMSMSVVEGIFQPSGMNSSNDFRNPSHHGSNPDKVPNISAQAVQVDGSGINPDRLAMLAAAEEDDNETSDFETTVGEIFSHEKKAFSPSATFGSKDNAIPLKFNRLAGK